MLESKVRHLGPAQTAQVQPDFGPNVSPLTDVSVTCVLALPVGRHDTPQRSAATGKRTAAGLNLITFFPLVLRTDGT